MKNIGNKIAVFSYNIKGFKKERDHDFHNITVQDNERGESGG
jgi:hypothetical protein